MGLGWRFLRLAREAEGEGDRWSFKTVAEAVEWLSSEACQLYLDTQFARKYGGFA